MTEILATDEDKLKALALLESLPSRKSSSAVADEAGYSIALENTYRAGLFAAVKSILKGTLGHAFYPSPSELRQQHDREMATVWAREARQRRYLESDIDANWRPPTAEEKARSKAVYERFCEQWQETRSVDKRPEFDWDRVNKRFDERVSTDANS